MIEVMVTLLIILVGLLGIGGLQMQAQISELESYQRAQALISVAHPDFREDLKKEAQALNYF